MAEFHSLTVSTVSRTTRDAVLVSFEVPSHLSDIYSFRAGQYLTLRAEIGGETLRRSYSICSAPTDNLLRVAIKRIEDGVFSTWANTQLAAGHSLDVMPPEGNFTEDFEPKNQRHYVAFAVGSGITPIFSLVKTALMIEPKSRVTLFFGNRSSSSVLFREELQDLKNLFMQRFSVFFVMSRERQDIDLFNGRLDGKKVEQLLSQWLDPRDIDRVLVCGPQTMNNDVLTVLQNQGLDKEQIKFELFVLTERLTPRPHGVGNRDESVKDECMLTVILDGRHRTLLIDRDKQSVLDAALAQGLELPYSCKSGVCATCRCKVTSGEVDLDVNFALEDYELARGFVLACQSYAMTDRVVIDFDQET